MKFTDNTLSVLKNFASINSGVVLNEGKIQKTISDKKSILVEANLENDIPKQFGIYDLNRFLGNITTLKNPELTFTSESVVMEDDDFSLTYMECSPNLIVTPPDKELVLKTVDVKFTMTNASIQKLLKIAAMNNLMNLSVVGEDGELRIKIHDKSKASSNFGTFKLGDYAGKDFIATFKTENLKLLPEDYDVEIQIGAFSKFVSKNGNLKYFIALESN